MKWISVKEQLPSKEELVLICNQHGSWTEGVYFEDEDHWQIYTDSRTAFILNPVTHWMEIQTPPKD